MFEELVVELSNKYSDKNYKYFDREDLYQEKGWSDLEVLCLLKFYKNKWSIQVPNVREYFPNFIFTYSKETLEKEIEKAQRSMEIAAKEFDFVAAARFRDKLAELKNKT